MARKRASMREGPLAELFRATEAAQRQAEKEGKTLPGEPLEETVEHRRTSRLRPTRPQLPSLSRNPPLRGHR